MELLDQLVTSDNIEKMRGLADSAKLYLSTDTHTINLWPAAIFSLIALLVLPVIAPAVIHGYLSLFKSSGYNRSDYEEDYDEDYGYDNTYSEFRKRRRGPGKRARVVDDEEVQPYSEDWKNSDYYNYYQSLDKQNRELETGGNLLSNMVAGLTGGVSNAMKMIN